MGMQLERRMPGGVYNANAENTQFVVFSLLALYCEIGCR